MPAAQGHCGQKEDKRRTKHRQISVFSWPEIGWAKVDYRIGAILIINGGVKQSGSIFSRFLLKIPVGLRRIDDPEERG